MKEITSRFDQWGGFVVSGFVEPEVISALAKYAREHPNYSAEYLRKHPAVVDNFRKDLAQPAVTIVSVDDEAVSQASDLLRRKPEYAIHAGDALHLVTALAVREELKPPDKLVFVTADRGLEAAAKAEGLPTLNPMWQGVDALRTIPGISPS
jgi:predicted nucleic acid-binding protein